MLKKAGRRDRQSDEWRCISAHQWGKGDGEMVRWRRNGGWRNNKGVGRIANVESERGEC